MKFLFAVLAIACGILLYRFIRLAAKRYTAVRKLKRISSPEAKVELLRSPLATLFGMAKKPDVRVETEKAVYLARFYNGRGRRACVHFADEEFSASYYRLTAHYFFHLSRIRGSRLRKPQGGGTSAIRVRVKLIPPLDAPKMSEGSAPCEKKTIPVIILNPAPSEVSYVTDEGNAIRQGYTGDEFRGIKIHTGSSFAAFLEREAESTRSSTHDEF